MNCFCQSASMSIKTNKTGSIYLTSSKDFSNFLLTSHMTSYDIQIDVHVKIKDNSDAKVSKYNTHH